MENLYSEDVKMSCYRSDKYELQYHLATVISHDENLHMQYKEISLKKKRKDFLIFLLKTYIVGTC